MDTRAISSEPLHRSFPEPVEPVELLRILRRRRTLIILTMLIIIGLTALAVRIIEPRYTAIAVMRVDDEENGLTDRAADLISIRDAELRQEQRMATQIGILQSRPLARQVVRDLALHDDSEFNPSSKPKNRTDASGLGSTIRSWLSDPSPSAAPNASKTRRAAPAVSPQELEKIVDRLLDRVDVAQDGRSNFINVTATSTDRAKAVRIANKIATTYVRSQVEEKKSANNRNIAVLTDRVEELRQQLLNAEWSVASYKRANRIDTGMGADTGATQMGRLASELASARGMRAEAEVRSVGGRTAPGSGSAMSALLTELRSQEATLQRQMAELSTLYGAGHPDVLKTTAELAEIQRNIVSETSRIGEGLRNEASAQRAKEAQLSGDLGALRSTSFQQNMASVNLGELERNAETTGALYLGLLSRLKELRRQDHGMKADASFASRALLPSEPSFPKPKQMMGVAAAGSVILALILAMVAEGLDSRVRTATQVEQLLGIPTLAMIPEIPRLWKDMPAHVAVKERPHSAFAEAIRSTQMELAWRMPENGPRVIMVTSALPGEGKTTLSIALAAAAIAVGQSAIVVDFDLRRPGLTKLLRGVRDGPDLLTYLAGEADLAEVIVADSRLPSLATIPVARRARDPGALLSSPRVQALFQELREHYDLTVISTPPILAARDAKVLAGFADSVLLVIRWAQASPDVLRSAAKIFEGDFTGAVFNQVNYRKHAGRAYGDALEHYGKYSTYYDDHDDDDEAKPAGLFAGARRLFQPARWRQM